MLAWRSLYPPSCWVLLSPQPLLGDIDTWCDPHTYIMYMCGDRTRWLCRQTPTLSNKSNQEPTETSKQPIRTRYLGHVTSYSPISDQYFLIRSDPAQ
eukprot:sb/3479041/